MVRPGLGCLDAADHRDREAQDRSRDDHLGTVQEVALCHGWVDTQIQRIDDERYAIRFVPRRPGSNWSATNRTLARRLLAEGRIQPAGLTTLPGDL